MVAPQVCYWGFRDWLINEAPLFGYRVDLADMTDLAAVRAAIKPDTKLVWIETPGNPLWNITDIAAVAADSRMRAAPRSASIRPPRRRCSRGRSRSAPTS